MKPQDTLGESSNVDKGWGCQNSVLPALHDLFKRIANKNERASVTYW